MERLTKLARKEDGATIIEYAVVAPVVFLLVFAIIEFSLLMFAYSVVEGATANAARLSRTGAERSTAADQSSRQQADMAKLREMILDRGAPLIKSDRLNITVLPQGGSAGNTMGGSGERVIYQVTYNWNISTPFIGELLTEDGVYTISSIAVVVNEPFDDNPQNNQF